MDEKSKETKLEPLAATNLVPDSTSLVPISAPPVLINNTLILSGSPALKRPGSLKIKRIETEDQKKRTKPIPIDFNVYKADKSDIIKLNIGGQIFSTYKSTLTKKIPKQNSEELYAANLLEELLNGTQETRLDENGAIFIDRNPRYFEYILDYLRMANTNYDFSLPTRDILLDLEKDCVYFKINGLKELLLFYDSNILNKSLKLELIKLCDIKLKENWRLIYRATTDGFSSTAFHNKCDGIANTLTIVKTLQSNIFGGYTEAAWSQINSHVSDANAFIFSLVNKDKKPILMKCSNAASAIFCGSTYGPTFGEGHDFYIAHNSNLNTYSLSNLGFTYKHPQYANGTNSAKLFLAGSFNFQTSEIEVYAKS